MKIRWTRNSVRFRITPTELAQLENGERVEEEIQGPPGGSWRAVIVPGAERTSLDFVAGELSLPLSTVDLARLTEPEAEGIYLQTEEYPVLRYYIEKDFPCVHPRAGEARETPTESFAPPPDFEERKQ